MSCRAQPRIMTEEQQKFVTAVADHFIARATMFAEIRHLDVDEYVSRTLEILCLCSTTFKSSKATNKEETDLQKFKKYANTAIWFELRKLIHKRGRQQIFEQRLFWKSIKIDSSLASFLEPKDRQKQLDFFEKYDIDPEDWVLVPKREKWMVEQLVTGKTTVAKLAQQLNCCVGTIYNRLRNIPIILQTIPEQRRQQAKRMVC